MKIENRTKLILLILLLFASSANAQEENSEVVTNSDGDLILNSEGYLVSSMDPENYGMFTPSSYLDTDSEYYKEDYTSKSYDYKDAINDHPMFNETRDRNFLPGNFFGAFLKIIFFLLIALVVFALFMIFKDFNFRNRSQTVNVKKEQINSEEKEIAAPEELDQSTLQDLLKNAESQGDYFTAVRCYFLMYLEKLQRQKEIVYNKDKTNADYLKEIEDKTSGEVFSQLSYLFEYIWYGKKSINAHTYETVAFTFEKALK